MVAVLKRHDPVAPDDPGPEGDGRPAGSDRPSSDRRRRSLGPPVLLGVAAWSTWLLARGWFYSDDLYNLTEARTRPFGWDYLTRDLFGHVVPGFMTVVWAVAHPGGADYRWAMAGTVVGLVAVVALSRALAVRLGATPAAAWAAAAVTGANVAWASTAWWAAAVNWVPSAICGLVLVLGHVGWLEERRLRHLVLAVGALAVGLSFQESGVVFLVTAAALTATRFLDGSPAERCRGLLRLWPTWLAYGVPVAATGILWATSARGMGEHPAPASILAFPAVLAAVGYLPAQVGVSLRFVAGPLVVAVAAVGVLGGLAAARRWLHRVGPAGWMPLVVVGATVAVRGILVGWARLPTMGFDAARDHRYLVDLVWIGPVLVAAAWSARPIDERTLVAERRVAERRVAGIVVGTLVILGLLGQLSEAPKVGGEGARSYRDRFVASYEDAVAAEPDAVLLDVAAGPELTPPLLARFTLLSRTITFATGPLPFDVPGRPLLAPAPDGTVGRVRLVTAATGDLAGAELDGVTASPAASPDATGGTCWTAGATDGAVTVALDRALPLGTHVLLLDGVDATVPWRRTPPRITVPAAAASSASAAASSTDDTAGSAEIPLDFVVHGSGAGSVLLTPIPFEAARLRFAVPAGERLCLGSLAVADLALRR